MRNPLSLQSWLAGLAVLVLAPSTAVAHSGDVFKHYGTGPSTASTFSIAKYGGSCIGPKTATSGAKSYHFTICGENNAHNDFWGLQIDDSFDSDAVALWLDNNDDEQIVAATNDQCPDWPAPVEDWLTWDVVGPGLWNDGYYCFGPHLAFTGDTSHQNGYGGCAPAGPPDYTQETCQFRHPLDSGDADDDSLKLGDTVGWCLTYDDKSNPADAIGSGSADIQYPPGCWHGTDGVDAVHGSAAKYGEAVQAYDLRKAVKQLGGLVATCQYCPPDPGRVLDGELAQVRVALTAQHPAAATRSLIAFQHRVRGLASDRRLSLRFAARLVASAQRTLDAIARATAPAKAAPRLPGSRG